MDDLILVLEKAWSEGFFYELRSGNINENELEQLKQHFDSFSFNDHDINKEFVSLLWIIPTFITWQKERLLKSGYSEEIINEVYNYFYNKCEDILGIP